LYVLHRGNHEIISTLLYEAVGTVACNEHSRSRAHHETMMMTMTTMMTTMTMKIIAMLIVFMETNNFTDNDESYKP